MQVSVFSVAAEPELDYREVWPPNPWSKGSIPAPELPRTAATISKSATSPELQEEMPMPYLRKKGADVDLFSDDSEFGDDDQESGSGVYDLCRRFG